MDINIERCGQNENNNGVMRRSRKRKGPNKKWREDEVRTLIEFIKQNRDFEKPTARAYYKKLLDENQLELNDWNLVRLKVRNLKSNYKKAKDWEKKTISRGVVVMSDGESSKDILLKMCAHFYELEDIFGSKDFSFETVIMDSTELHSDESFLSPPSLNPTLNSGNPDFTLCIEENTTSDSIESSFSKSRESGQKGIGSKMAMSEILKIQSAMIEVKKKKIDIEEKEFDLKERQLMFEKEKIEKQINLQKEKDEQQRKFEIEKLDFEKEKAKQEFQLRNKEIESQENFKRLELEMKERVLMKELELKYNVYKF